jgi:hypothetical protein
MKNKLLVACMIVILSATTNLKVSAGESKPGYETVINDYIDSYMRSDYKKLKHILSDDATVKIPRAEKVIVQNKNSLVENMRADQGTIQQCSNKYQVISSSSALVIARVDFLYTNFDQQNFIVLEKDDNQEWKITEICKIFQDKVDHQSVPQNISAKVN